MDDLIGPAFADLGRAALRTLGSVAMVAAGPIGAAVVA